jgi:RNA polymerase sigma-70 factor, ECF subfamily
VNSASGPTLNELAQRAAAGDTAAFAAIVTRLQGPLFGFFGRMSLSPAQADEVAQDTFVRAWTNLARFDPRRARFSTWLFTIARNQALNELNRAGPLTRYQSLDLLAEYESLQPTPDQLLDRKQADARLHAAIRRLTASERSALALAYVHELDMAQIAQIEGVSIVAIKTRLHRSRRKLRHWLEHEDA